MPDSRLLRYVVGVLAALMILTVLVWRGNPRQSDVDTTQGSTTTGPASTSTSKPDEPGSSTSTSTSTTAASSTSSTSTTTEAAVVEVSWPGVVVSGEPGAVVTST